MKKIITFSLTLYAFTFTFNSFGMLTKTSLPRTITTHKKMRTFCTQKSDFDLGKIIACNKGTPTFTQELQTNNTNTALLEKIIEQNKENNDLLRLIIKQNYLHHHTDSYNYDIYRFFDHKKEKSESWEKFLSRADDYHDWQRPLIKYKIALDKFFETFH